MFYLCQAHLTAYTLQGVIALIKHLPLEKLGALKLLQKNTDKYPNTVKGDELELTHLPQTISIWKREPKRANMAKSASFSRSKICYVQIFYVQIQNIHFVFVPSKKKLVFVPVSRETLKSLCVHLSGDQAVRRFLLQLQQRVSRQF